MTVRDAAEQCHVSYHGLQTYLLYYHREMAEKRMVARVALLDQPRVIGVKDARNQLIGPKPEIAARYARAVEMYKHTDLSLTEIVRRCDVEERGFRSFVRRWHCDAMQERKDKRHAAHLQKISRPKGPTKAEKAEANYVPAVPLLLAGKSFKEVSQILGVSPENLCTWIKTHRPDVMEQARLGRIITPEGLRISRARYFRYQPVAAYMDIHPAEPTAEVAKRFGVPVSSLSKAVSRIFPDTWELHLKTLGGGSDK